MLAPRGGVGYFSHMEPTEVAQTALALPEAERLELARRLIESIASVGADGSMAETDPLIAQGVRRIEEVVNGKVVPLNEEQPALE